MITAGWVPVVDFVVASGWCDAVALAGITVDPAVQAEAEAATLSASGVAVVACVRNDEPDVWAWAKALDASVAQARERAGAAAARSALDAESARRALALTRMTEVRKAAARG